MNADVIVDNFGAYNLSGGVLEIADDLRLNGNAVFNISGDATVAVADDLRVGNGSNVVINVELVGDVAPTIDVADDLVLRNTTTLNIDATNWTGDDAVTLFSVNDRIVGQFDSVTLDGVEVPRSQYEFSSGRVIISVPEPSSSLSMLLLATCVLVPISRPVWRHTPRGRRTGATTMPVCNQSAV